MQAQQQQTPDRAVAAQPPVVLELGDGSRLVLDEAAASPIICRVEGMGEQRISLDDAQRLSGQPFAGFRRLQG